jgi:putative membrane protein
MTLLALLPAGLAAAVHGYFFVLESLRFDRPSTWRTFGVPDAEQAAAARPWAYNQGFYNLFLGIGTAVGVVLVATGNVTAGASLVAFGCACMVGAAVVLATSDRSKLRGALIQGVLPAIALALLGLGSR